MNRWCASHQQHGRERMLKKIKNENGVAIIIVISVLAVMTSLVAAFLITSRLEAIKTANFIAERRAVYLAEAGLAHAKGLLREDKESTIIDIDTETWHAAFVGTDVDTNEDGVSDAQWINLVDAAGETYGRYAVSVFDEARKVNINSAGFHNEEELKVTEGYSTFEVSLSALFDAMGIVQADQMQNDILLKRYGGNVPGSSNVNIDDNDNNTVLSNDGIDNDADGIVDEASEGINEPQEFVAFYPYGDDRPFFSIFELKNIASVAPHFNSVRPYVSAYAFDRNTNKDGTLRLDINRATALDIMNEFASVDLTHHGQLAVNIVDYRDQDHESTELVFNGTYYQGVEGVRINEIMVSPKYGYVATSLTNPTGPGGDWSLVGSHYENANPTMDEFGRGNWHFENIRPGTYYMRLYGAQSTDIVGDVKIDGLTHSSLQHGEMFVQPVTIAADGRLDVTIYNKEVDKGPNFTTRFYAFQLFESPDCEYIELINITNETIDISNWRIEGLRKEDLIGSIPVGTTIGSFDYVVLAVDKDDVGVTVPVNIKNNGICLLNTWSGSLIDSDHVVQLLFSDIVSREDDVINDVPSILDNVLMLKTGAGEIVDRVQYREDFSNNVSFERGDPTSTRDLNGDHIFDDWNKSNGFAFFNPVGTPTQINANASVSGHILGGLHSEILVKNGELSNIGELPRVAAKADWQTISTTELKQFCDRFTTYSYRLEAEGHQSVAGGWQEIARPSPVTNWYQSSSSGEISTWIFNRNDRFHDGSYWLTICGEEGEALSISLKRKDGSWSAFTPPLTPGTDNCVHYGIVSIGGTEADALPSQSLEMQIKNESTNNICHFDYVYLSPINKIEGRINVNTASEEVLQAMPGINAQLAANIIAGRPYGLTYGIGDLLEGDILGDTEAKRKEAFKKICNLVTTKSETFEVNIKAQVLQKGNVKAERKLRVIVER